SPAPLVLPLPAASAAALVAAVTVVAARTGRTAGGDLGWWEPPPADDPGLPRFSPWRPVRITLEAGVPFSALVAEAETALAEARARGPFPTDLPSRQGSAPSGAVGPEGPPLALGIDLDPEAGDPVPPFAVSIPSDGG